MSIPIARVATATTYDVALRNVTTRQSNLTEAQEKLTSGKRVVRASDDPVSAAQAERALTRLARVQTEQRALENHRNTIAQAESTLGDSMNLVQEARQLLVNAGSATLTPADRQTIANQLQGLREQLLDFANRKDTNGVPLLSALGSAQVPFSGPLTTAPDYTFAGLPGQSANTSVNIASTLDGDSAFMFRPQRDGAYNAQVTPVASSRQLTTSPVTATNLAAITGDNYTIAFSAVGPGATTGTTTASYTITNTTTGVASAPVVVPDFASDKPVTIAVTGIPGMSLDITTSLPANGDTVSLNPSPSLFSALDSAITQLRGAANSNGAIQAVGQALSNVDKGLERMSQVRGYAGELLNRADRITGDQENRTIQLEADRSRAEDLDMIQGISDFQNQQTGYEAALKSYAQVQRLSLFNFIS